MFKKKYSIILVFVGVLLVVYLFYRNSYLEYEPVIFDGNSYKTQTINNKVEFNNRLKKVLNYYNEDFKTSDKGQILIRQSLFSNKELINNYTKKALDKSWSPESQK